jgi:hypothetical protein
MLTASKEEDGSAITATMGQTPALPDWLTAR